MTVFHAILSLILISFFVYSGLNNLVDPKTRKIAYLYFVSAGCVLFMTPPEYKRYPVVQTHLTNIIYDKATPVVGHILNDTIYLEIK